MIKNILSIAGSDPSGGAGIQADLKTFGALGAYGMAAITALTAQNTTRVSGVHHVPAAFVANQVKTILDDIRVDAIKIGMAGTAETIETIADILKTRPDIPLVVDPVMVSTSGDDLSSQDSIKALKQSLIPLAMIITPNITEAETLLGRKYEGDQTGFAKTLLGLGPCGVCLKGGHIKGDKARDVYVDDKCEITLAEDWIDTKNTHGTGCTLSSALAVFLAQGLSPEDSCARAKSYVTQALRAADHLTVGHDNGPLNHFYHNQ